MTDGKVQEVRRFLERKGWVGRPEEVSFLAAGEYNENYLVRSQAGRFVLRINHGSQLGLADQIGYEYRVLKAVEPSGVTPRALGLDLHPEELDGGTLLMEYLPGRFLDYRSDWAEAARVLARVHALPPAEGLLVQEDPVVAIARESQGLIARYPDHPLTRQRAELERYQDKIRTLAETTRELFAGERLCIVNSEVNSHNFLVDQGGARLVDWEKAVISSRYQDLGHFLVPTTTLWKSDYVYSQELKVEFLREYRSAAGLRIHLSELLEKTGILERTILLRALSWCYMAYYEYTRTERSLRNRDTFEKIKSYLTDIECFLT